MNFWLLGQRIQVPFCEFDPNTADIHPPSDAKEEEIDATTIDAVR